MPKSLFAPLFFLCVFFTSARAQCVAPLQVPDATQLQVAQRQAKDHGFLWRLQKDGRSSYLYGTLHVARLEWAFPGPLLLQALRTTERLALELNVLDPDTVKALQAGARAPAPQPAPAAFAAWVKVKVEALCLNLTELQAMNPGFQAVTISLAEARRQGLEAAYGIDLFLAMGAQANKRPIDALETVQTQLGVMSVVGTQEEAEALEDMNPDALDKQNDVLTRAARAWETNDYATLNDYARWCHCMESDADRKRMKRALEDRNPHLADGIDALHMQGHKVLAAVGSLHMIGADSGLPALMAQRGYLVERVF